MPEGWRLILIAVAGMVILLWLIIRLKLHALVALVLVSVGLGLAAGMTPTQVLDSVQRGMGGTLGAIALLVGLGSMFGQMLEVSGGAEIVAQRLIGAFGQKRAPWALGLTGFIVSIPIFFDVAFVILVPIVYGLSRRAGQPIVFYGVPLIAGMAVTHAFVPPTPGPIAVAGLLGADLGYVILFGVLAGIPAMIIAGPLYGRWIARRVTAGVPQYIQAPAHERRDRPAPPPFWLIAVLILTPLLLIVARTVSDMLGKGMDAAALERTAAVRMVVGLLGEPVIALLITTLLCFRLLGTSRGYTREQVQEIATRSLEPAGIILLVTGAGGVLKQVLVDSKVGEVVAGGLIGSGAPVVLMAFVLAAAVRVMQGSATVAMMTAGGLTASLLAEGSLSAPRLALLSVAIASGATIASHVNDSGFWLVNRFFGLTVADTLRSWTMVTTLVSLIGLAMVLLMWQIVE